MWIRFVLTMLLLVLCLSMMLSSPTENYRPYQPVEANDTFSYPSVQQQDTLIKSDIQKNGMFQSSELEQLNDYTNTVLPLGSFTHSQPSRPHELPLRQFRSLQWNCQRPWMQCCAPSYGNYPPTSEEEETSQMYYPS